MGSFATGSRVGNYWQHPWFSARCDVRVTITYPYLYRCHCRLPLLSSFLLIEKYIDRDGPGPLQNSRLIVYDEVPSRLLDSSAGAVEPRHLLNHWRTIIATGFATA